MMRRRYIGKNVLDAAKERIRFVLGEFERVYLSFSGGKDSTVLFHLLMEELGSREEKIGILFVDLEAQYQYTIAHVAKMLELYREKIEPYWVALPIALRNAVSVFEPKWLCWDPSKQDAWVRSQPPQAITDPAFFPFFRPGMEFEEFVLLFGEWYSQGKPTACLVAIRGDESLNRFRTIFAQKKCYQGVPWTTQKTEHVYNCYPLYDWRTKDIWVYQGRSGKPYNLLYDLMHKAGLSIHEQRICQPYGDDQRKGLWLFHVIEPQTWSKVVARVNGSNQGAIYARETGNILGRIKISKPQGHTWQSFAKLLLESLPPPSKEQFENKITVFIHWWAQRGYADIPDEADPRDEAARRVPSWRRICKALLRNDYWCKGLSFSQTKSHAAKRYKELMRKRRAQWGITW